MGGTGVIDRFLEVFTPISIPASASSAAKSPFSPRRWSSSTSTLAALFWSWAPDEDVIARLVKKTLFVGVFAFLIGNCNNLARIVFESFLRPWPESRRQRPFRGGFPAARPRRAGRDRRRPADPRGDLRSLMGYVSFFENFIQIAVLLFAWLIVLLSFFILAIQLFVTLIEFKLTTLAGFVLIPFGLFGKTAFLAERVLGNVVSSGVKVLVLAVIIGIGSTLFSQFTQGAAAPSRRSTTP